MNDIEQKALALVRKEDGKGYLNYDAAFAALCRAIEQHEAFRQEVSDAVVEYYGEEYVAPWFAQFIIPKPKPDPLVEIFNEVDNGPAAWGSPEEYAAKVRAALDARGLEIREKGQ
jgi:hypothetical protein